MVTESKVYTCILECAAESDWEKTWKKHGRLLFPPSIRVSLCQVCDVATIISCDLSSDILLNYLFIYQNVKMSKCRVGANIALALIFEGQPPKINELVKINELGTNELGQTKWIII